MAGSWGDIRAELESEFEGIGFDLLDSKIRSAYEDILGERDWSWLKGTDRVECEAKYTTGTITLTQGSASITGVDTAWNLDLDGRELQLVARNEVYDFTFVDATTATLDRPYEGETASDVAYILFRRTYALSVLVKGIQRAHNPRTIKNLDEKNRTDLLNRALVFGEPGYYAMAPSAGEDPVYKNITFWPAPESSLSIDIDYQKAVANFNGENTGESPLPEVYIGAIVDLAASKLYATKKYKDLALATARSELAKSTLDRMHREENLRIPPSEVEISDHYTSHELKRFTR